MKTVKSFTRQFAVALLLILSPILTSIATAETPFQKRIIELGVMLYKDMLEELGCKDLKSKVKKGGDFEETVKINETLLEQCIQEQLLMAMKEDNAAEKRVTHFQINATILMEKYAKLVKEAVKLKNAKDFARENTAEKKKLDSITAVEKREADTTNFVAVLKKFLSIHLRIREKKGEYESSNG